MASKRRSRLPWIEPHGAGFRAWWIDLSGLRRRGPVRSTPELAYDDAAAARRRPPARSSGLTIGGAIALLEADLDAKERTAGTKAWAAGQKRTLLRYYRADAALDTLTLDELQAWFDLRRKTVSASTLRHHLRYLSRMFGIAVRAGWAGDVPLRRLVLPAVRAHRPSVFGWQEALDLLERVRDAERHLGVVSTDGGAIVRTATQRPGQPAVVTKFRQEDADLLELVLRTGLRRSELARLRPQDVDLRAQVLRVSGKRGPRVVPLSAQAATVAQKVALAQVTPRDISRLFLRWSRRLGEPRLHPHAFRHTLATELVRRGTPLATVASILGHAPGSFRVTLGYYSASEPSLRQAIEAL